MSEPLAAAMTTTLRLRLGLLPLLAALAGCSDFVEGNGVHAVRVLDASTGLPEFTSAVVGFPGDVDVSGHPPSATIHADAQERRVELSGDENVIELIEVRVDASGALFTTIDVDGYSSVHPPVLVVYAPVLVAVESKGGSFVTVQDAPPDDFAVTASDRGQVTLVGRGGGALEARVSGGAVLAATAYEVRSANLALIGASTAKVWPQQDVTGSAGDGCKVFVKGGAGCNLELSGSASCEPLQ